ncbi:MAG: hypothetical protein R3B45_10495 [Bdellovibrionota bacterium]
MLEHANLILKGVAFGSILFCLGLTDSQDNIDLADDEENVCVNYFLPNSGSEDVEIPQECKREDYNVQCTRVFGGTACTCCPK